jgi:hypothetical protein
MRDCGQMAHQNASQFMLAAHENRSQIAAHFDVNYSPFLQIEIARNFAISMRVRSDS